MSPKVSASSSWYMHVFKNEVVLIAAGIQGFGEVQQANEQTRKDCGANTGIHYHPIFLQPAHGYAR